MDLVTIFRLLTPLPNQIQCVVRAPAFRHSEVWDLVENVRECFAQ